MLELESLVLPAMVVAVAVAAAMVETVIVAGAQNYLRLCTHHLALERASLPEGLEWALG